MPTFSSALQRGLNNSSTNAIIAYSPPYPSQAIAHVLLAPEAIGPFTSDRQHIARTVGRLPRARTGEDRLDLLPATLNVVYLFPPVQTMNLKPPVSKVEEVLSSVRRFAGRVRHHVNVTRLARRCKRDIKESSRSEDDTERRDCRGGAVDTLTSRLPAASSREGP